MPIQKKLLFTHPLTIPTSRQMVSVLIQDMISSSEGRCNGTHHGFRWGGGDQVILTLWSIARAARVVVLPMMAARARSMSWKGRREGNTVMCAYMYNGSQDMVYELEMCAHIPRLNGIYISLPYHQLAFSYLTGIKLIFS